MDDEYELLKNVQYDKAANRRVSRIDEAIPCLSLENTVISQDIRCVNSSIINFLTGMRQPRMELDPENLRRTVRISKIQAVIRSYWTSNRPIDGIVSASYMASCGVIKDFFTQINTIINRL